MSKNYQSNCKKIESIKMDSLISNRLKTKEEFQNLIVSLRNLTSLRYLSLEFFYHGEGVTDTELDYFSQGLQSLRSLQSLSIKFRG